MVQVVKTDEIKFNEDTLKVADLPEHVQSLVGMYDEWRQEEEDARVALIQKEMAVGALQDRIADAIRSASADTEEKAVDKAVEDTTAEAEVTEEKSGSTEE